MRAARRVHALALLGLAALIAAAYANSLSADFVLDSRVLILENPLLRAPTWDNVATIVSHDYWHPAAANGLYRPLTTLSYLFNYSVLGNADRALGYHVVNLILHWSCTALTYGLMLQLGAPAVLAAVAAALFAVHPITTEAVTNIVGRADLLAAFAVLAGLACHVQACARRGASRRLWLLLLCALALVGVFSKENAVVLLPIIVAWELIRSAIRAEGTASAVPGGAKALPSRDFKPLAASTLSVGLILIVALAIGAWVRANNATVQSSTLDNPILAADFWAGRATAVEVIGLQIWQLLLPATLSADYSYNQIPIVSWPPSAWTVAACITVALVIIAGVSQRTRRPGVAFLVAFFLIALLPTANLFVVIGSIRADRFLYLPLVGFIGALTLAAWELLGSERAHYALIAILLEVIVAGVWLTATRNRDWASEGTLWTSTIAVAPDSAKAQKGYAAAMFARGGDANVNLAIVHGERAVAIRPDYVDALLDLGGYYVAGANQRAAAGQPEVARALYERATHTLRRGRHLDRANDNDLRKRSIAHGQRDRGTPTPGSAALYRNLALAYFGRGDLDHALTANHYARRLDPSTLQTYFDISGLQARRGQWDAAAVALFEVVALEGNNREAWTRLAELYQVIEPGTSALVADENGVDVDERHPLVRRHACAAHAELARIFARARLRTVERQARVWLTQHCVATEEQASPPSPGG